MMMSSYDWKLKACRDGIDIEKHIEIANQYIREIETRDLLQWTALALAEKDEYIKALTKYQYKINYLSSKLTESKNWQDSWLIAWEQGVHRNEAQMQENHILQAKIEHFEENIKILETELNKIKFDSWSETRELQIDLNNICLTRTYIIEAVTDVLLICEHNPGTPAQDKLKTIVKILKGTLKENLDKEEKIEVIKYRSQKKLDLLAKRLPHYMEARLPWILRGIGCGGPDDRSKIKSWQEYESIIDYHLKNIEETIKKAETYYTLMEMRKTARELKKIKKDIKEDKDEPGRDDVYGEQQQDEENYERRLQT